MADEKIIDPLVITDDDIIIAEDASNTQMKHGSLYGRDEPGQHEISAITGLEEELKSLKTLKTVCSDKKGAADYYEWVDGNPNSEVRIGYFVSVIDKLRKIEISAGASIFGVTVDSAAFVGGDCEAKRDSKYGLVAHSGVVAVLCEAGLQIGDYVTSNSHGMARKTDNDCGCKVIAFEDVDHVEYALISLNVAVDEIDRMGRKMVDLDIRIDNAVVNINTALNAANEAYKLAQAATGDIGKVNADISNKANEALDKANTAVSTTEKIQEQITQAQTTATQAKTIAESAVISVETKSNEAIEAANQVKEDLIKLSEDMKPLTEWTDGTNSGAAGFVAQADENATQLATISKHTYGDATGFAAVLQQVEDHEATIQTIVNWDGPDGESLVSIQQKADANEASIQMLCAHIDKYSVGEYSPANSFTLAQAQEVLEEGVVYVPTVDHTETYEGAPEPKEFTREYFYTWGVTEHGFYWIESEAPMAVFIPSEPAGNEAPFWYTDDGAGDVTEGYEPHTLYRREFIGNEPRWIAVATLKGNASSRAISQIRQNTNEIASEITNARGDANSINQRLTDDENSIALVVAESDGEKVVNAASIVTAINDKDSSVAINANKIVIDGATTFLNSWVSEDDATCIDGGKIYANSITADQIDVDTLDVKKITIKNDDGYTIFKTTENSAKIGGWSADNNSLYNGDDFNESDVVLCATGTNGKFTIAEHEANGWVVKAGDKFGVTKDGEMYCSDAHIKGTIFANNMGMEGYDELPIDFRTSFVGEVETGHEELVTGSYHLTTSAVASKEKLEDAVAHLGSNYEVHTINTEMDVASFVEIGMKSGLDNCVVVPQPYIKIKVQGVADQVTAKDGSAVQMLNYIAVSGPEIDMTRYRGVLRGTWQSTDNITLAASEQTTSDRNKKNSIEVIPGAYNTLYKNLKPVIYKYNDGTSDRYHIGFIAQDVNEALEAAGLTAQDFAALCIADEGTENEIWRLRYSEFVALNTWKIQQLENKVTEQEQRIEYLEQMMLKLINNAK